MNAEDRQQMILQILDATGQVSISDLSARLTVSEMTIRRDLGQLHTDGMLRRTHGGAVRTQSGSFEPSFSMRSRLNVEAKKAIAATVARELVDGQTVILDGGTTGVAIAEALVGRNLTVCALNTRVADILVSAPATRVMIPGGTIRPGELSIIGPAAERTLTDFRFDVYIMTASGVDATAGLTEWNVDDAAVKRTALSSARNCIVACDSSKFGHTAFARIASLDVADLIVTDAALASDQHQAFVATGTSLRIA